MPDPSCKRRHAARLGFVVGCAVLLASCGGDSEGPATTEPTPPTTTSGQAGSLTVKVAPARAMPGDVIEASVVNEGAKQFTYGADYELERRAGGGYEKVELPNRAAIAIGYIAAPGETGPAVKVKLPPDLAQGSYRVVIQRDVPGVGDLSGQFEITGR